MKREEQVSSKGHVMEVQMARVAKVDKLEKPHRLGAAANASRLIANEATPPPCEVVLTAALLGIPTERALEALEAIKRPKEEH